MATTSTAYSFRVILSGVVDFDDAMTDALYEAGCSDGAVCSNGGVVYVDFFERGGDSLADAVASAMKDVAKAGYRVARVEVEGA